MSGHIYIYSDRLMKDGGGRVRKREREREREREIDVKWS